MKIKYKKQKLLATTEELKRLKPLQLLLFIKSLQAYLQKQRRQIRCLQRKLRTQSQCGYPTCTIATQTTDKYCKENSEQNIDEELNVPAKAEISNVQEDDRNKAVSEYLEDIKKAATEGMIKQLGLVYEPTSGLYYDPITKYYYNSEYNLYYDGTNGHWLKYNEDSFEYEFYSQATPLQSEKEVHDSDVSKLIKEFSTLELTKMRRNALAKLYVEKSDRHRSNHCSSREYSSDDVYKPRSKKNKKKHKKDRHSSSRKKHRNRSSSPGGSRSPSKPKDRKQRKKKRKMRRSQSDSLSESKNSSEIEEGELSKSGSESLSSVIIVDEDNSTKHFRHPRKDVAAFYPPSLRLIVQETNLEQLKVGSLFIVTYLGGSLGREGQHDVIIPAAFVSKNHLKFMYNRNKNKYQCEDLGSRNGTILNGKRISESKVKSGLKTIKHESVIELDQTKILCHIHEGLTTCVKCEPGLVQKPEVLKPSLLGKEVLTHKEGLKQLQKLYGLEKIKYTKEDTGETDDYIDRAKERRIKVGSTNHKEKTETASVDISIANSNKGFKMLAKLGWNEGECLGKNDEGLKEPLPFVSNEGKRGFGCEPIAPVNLSINKYKAMIFSKTKERYEKSNVASAILESSSDSD